MASKSFTESFVGGHTAKNVGGGGGNPPEPTLGLYVLGA